MTRANNSLEALAATISDDINNLRQRRIASKYRRVDRVLRTAEDLRAGRPVTDFWFDQIYPKKLRDHSETHWTPVRVAQRAAELLIVNKRTRVLDIGSGCGKFCIVGSLMTPGQFIGVEQRSYLVDSAHRAARKLNAKRASFIVGNMADLDWSFFDTFYLYNPFYEHRHPTVQLDQTIEFSEERFELYVRFVESKLRAAQPGTRVVTYYGFGGQMPIEYRCVLREPAGTGVLELWIKQRPVLKYAPVENPSFLE